MTSGIYRDQPLNERWKRRRLTTFLVYTFQYFVASVELSISYTTSWIYLKEVVSNDEKHVEIFYGLIHTSTFLPSVIFVNIITHYADKHRKIKTMILFANTVAMLGCVLYIFSNSPLLLIIGRFLTGFHLTIRPLMVGEMARSYEMRAFNTKMQIFRAVYVFGKAAGPLFVVAFLNTNFRMAELHIRYANVSALFSLGLLSVIQVLIIFFVHDLSREYDRKDGEMKLTMKLCEETQSNHSVESICIDQKSNHKVPEVKISPTQNNSKQEVSEDTKNVESNLQTESNDSDKKEGICSLLIRMLKDRDIIFLMVVTFVEEFIVQLMVLLIPVTVLEILNYSKTTVNYILAAQLISFLILFLIVYFARCREVHNAIIGWILSILFCVGVLLVRSSYGYTMNFIILTTCLTFIDIFGLNIRVFCSVSLAAIVQSKYQSFIDGLRTQFHFIGCVAGSLLSSVAISNRLEVCITLCVACVCVMCITVFRRKQLLYLKIKI